MFSCEICESTCFTEYLWVTASEKKSSNVKKNSVGISMSSQMQFLLSYYLKTCMLQKDRFLLLRNFELLGLKFLLFRKDDAVVRSRSSHPEVFCKNDVLRNFSKFKGKCLCKSLFFKSCWPQSPILLKKKLWHKSFPMNFAKFLSKPFLTEHLWLLLL